MYLYTRFVSNSNYKHVRLTTTQKLKLRFNLVCYSTVVMMLVFFMGTHFMILFIDAYILWEEALSQSKIFNADCMQCEIFCIKVLELFWRLIKAETKPKCFP